MARSTAVTDPASTSLAPAISLRDVSVRLGDRLALRGVSAEIASGAFVGLLGPNGSGKSTLLRAILGIVPLAEGEVAIEGQPPASARDLFSYLPQRQRVDFDAPLRVWDVVMMGRMRRMGWLRAPRPIDREVVASALERVAMIDRRQSPIGELSFGQQQRAFFARALAQEGRLILLDEPMNGVDSQTQALFLDLLEAFHHEGKTILMATHDLNMAVCVCDRLLILNQRLVAYGPVADVFQPDVLREAYGAHLHFVEVERQSHSQVLEDVHHHGDA